MTGKLDSTSTDRLYLLDESLVPRVAEALRLVGYNIVDVATAFGNKGVLDPEIIEWCRESDAVWIHADDRARRQHQIRLQTSGIRTVWLQRHGGAMSAREQLRILAFVVPKLEENWSSRRASRHYRVTATNPTSTPSVRRMEI